MDSLFSIKPLSGIISVQGGYAFNRQDFQVNGVPVLKIKNIHHREIDVSETDYVSPKIATQVARFYAKHGDILISMTGSGIQAPNSIVGRVARFKGNSNTYLINQRVGRIVIERQDLLDPNYLFFILTQAEIQWFLVSIATGSANQVNISNKQIEAISIPLPPLPEQRAIAQILGSLDDKIELNRRMNTTLEATARALFQSWFVDFDPVHAKSRGEQPSGMDAATAALFPDHFEDSHLGPIPAGWQVGVLSDGIELIGGGTPKTAIAEYWDGDIPWFSVKDVPSETDVFVIDTDKKITQAGVNNSSTRILPEMTTIISARGTVGKLALTGVQMAMNQSCYAIRGANYPDYFVFFLIRFAVVELLQRTHGTVFDTITRETFETIQIAFPSIEIADAFDRQIQPSLERIKNNLFESRTLAQTRDALLPKLISGEVRVENVESFIEGIV